MVRFFFLSPFWPKPFSLPTGQLNFPLPPINVNLYWHLLHHCQCWNKVFPPPIPSVIVSIVIYKVSHDNQSPTSERTVVFIQRPRNPKVTSAGTVGWGFGSLQMVSEPDPAHCLCGSLAMVMTTASYHCGKGGMILSMWETGKGCHPPCASG
jgi:hypothetical protein